MTATEQEIRRDEREKIAVHVEQFRKFFNRRAVAESIRSLDTGVETAMIPTIPATDAETVRGEKQIT